MSTSPSPSPVPARASPFRSLGNLSLGRRILLLTTAGLLAGAGALSYPGLKSTNEATMMMLDDRFTTATLVADYLDQSLHLCVDVLGETATRLTTPDGAADIDTQMENLRVTYTLLSVHVDSLYVFDASGRLVWSHPQADERAATVYTAITQTGGCISNLILSPVTAAPVVLLDATIPDGDNLQGGVIIVAIDLSQSGISGFIRPLRLGNTGYVEVVDQNGIVVARTEPGPKAAPFEKSDHSGHFSALIASGKPTRGLCHNCHFSEDKVLTRDVLAFMPLSTAPWGVVIRQSEDEALAPVRRLRRDLLLSGMGLVALALMLAVITTRDVVSRIKTLTSASQRIAEGNFDVRIVTAREDEVGNLAQTLDGMRSRLKTSYAETDRRTRELSSLLSVSEVLSSLPELAGFASALSSALDKTVEIVTADAGALLVWNEERREFQSIVQHGLPPDFTGATYSPKGETGEVDLHLDTPAAIDGLRQPSGATLREDLNSCGLTTLLSIPLQSKQVALGILLLANRQERHFAPADVRLVEGIARYIATALENTRLHQEVQRKEVVRGELLQDMLAVQEEERRRIARELHDETCQLLASLNANLQAAITTMPTDSARAMDLLRKVQSMSVTILDGTNRLIYQLRPSLLDDMGLVAAIRWLGNNNLKPGAVNVQVATKGRRRRLPRATETAIFRVVQETFNNILRHARAKNVAVTLQFEPHVVTLDISDDGIGFDVEEAIHTKARPRGLGLLGMRERIELIGGRIIIRSRPGEGTNVHIEIPDRKETAHGQNENTTG